MGPTDQLEHTPVETQRVQIDVVTRHEGTHKWRNRVVVGALAVAGVLGLYAAEEMHLLPDIHLPHISWPHLNVAGNEHATAGIDPHTYERGEAIALDCKGSKVNVPVNVRAHIAGNKWLLMGDANINKRYFGNFLPCGDTNTLYQTVQVEYAKEPHGPDRAKKVVATFPGISTQQARIDFSDERNCVPINATDSIATQQRKIRDYENKKKHHKHPKCDSLIDLTFTHVAPVTDTRLVPFSQTAAQMAIEVDADPTGADSAVKQAMVQEEATLKEDMTALIMAKYDVGKDDVIWQPDPTESPAERLMKRFDMVQPDYQKLFDSFHFKTGEHGRAIFYAKANGGGDAKIQLSSVRNRDVQTLNNVLKQSRRQPQ